MKSAGQFLVGLALAAGAAAAWAAPALPAPQEFYFDADPAAVPIVVVDGQGDDLVNRLARQRERGRRALEATVQLAGVAMAQGRPELGQTLYAEALQAAPVTTPMGRSVRWNYGWDLYRQGQTEPALEQWLACASSVRGNAAWVPPTFALALWKQGEREQAVKWYAAAVRTEPAQWSDSAQFARLLPTWREDERALLAEVQKAWAAQPPAWP